MRYENNEKVEVYLEKRQEKEKAIAFFQGELTPDDREVWVWLPKSQITFKDDGNVELPVWLAKKAGLI